MLRSEVFDYFYPRSEEEVILLLRELQLDPTASEFPDEICQLADNILTRIDSSIKALPSDVTREDSAAIAATTQAVSAELVAQFDLNISPQKIAMLVRYALPQAVRQADGIAKLQQQVFVKRLKQNQDKMLQATLEAFGRTEKEWDRLSNPNTAAAIVEQFAPGEQVDIDLFIKQANEKDAKRKEEEEIRKSAIAKNVEQQRNDEEIDVKDFLKAMGFDGQN
jgi:hypothetical protein